MSRQYVQAVQARIRRVDGAAELVNLAQFKAQRYEQDMVRVLAEIALDPASPGGLREKCAMDVIIVARGNPQPWAHNGQTIDPRALLPDGTTIDQAAVEAERESELHERLTNLTMSKTPIENWPEDVKRFAGDMLRFYAEDGVVAEKVED